MIPSRDLAFMSDDELLDDHHETFSQVKLQINEGQNDNDLETEETAQNDFDNIPIGIEAMEAYNVSKEKGKRCLRVDQRSGSSELCDLPLISVTPMTPGSNSPEDGHSTVSLNSSGGSPLFQNQKYRGQMSMSPNLYWRPQSPMPPKTDIEAKEFFAYRDSIVGHVVQEVEKLVEDSDGDLRGTWFLTEIDHWDNEKERIVILCEKALLIVKYDFIGMKKEDYRRVYLAGIDRILQGELKYPQRSIAPRLSGIAGGLVGVMKDCIIPTVQGTVESVGSAVMPKKNELSTDSVNEISGDSGEPSGDPSAISNQNNSNTPQPSTTNRASKTTLVSALALENFEPRTRNVEGIRLLWNEDLPLSFTQKWNPFNKSIPWTTFTSHPLLWHKGGGVSNRSFDVEAFSRDLIDVLSEGSGGERSPICRIEYKPIIIETYIGITSLFHNANSLGFYKVRGKVSF